MVSQLRASGAHPNEVKFAFAAAVQCLEFHEPCDCTDFLRKAVDLVGGCPDYDVSSFQSTLQQCSDPATRRTPTALR